MKKCSPEIVEEALRRDEKKFKNKKLKEKFFTTKDIDELKKALDKAGAKPITKEDFENLTFTEKEWEVLMQMDKWATKVLNEAQGQLN